MHLLHVMSYQSDTPSQVERGRHPELRDAGGLYAELWETLMRGEATPAPGSGSRHV